MIFYPLFVHLLISLKAPAIAVAGLVVTSLVYFYMVLRLRQNAGTRLAWIGLYALFAALGALSLLTNTVYALFLPPVLVNLGLLLLFGMTLRRTSVPLIERVMRMEYPAGELPPPLARYARNVTRVWVGFFGAVALTSAALAVAAPLEQWSLFSNVLSYVFGILLLLAQYAYRALRYREYGVFTPWNTLRCIARRSARERAELLSYAGQEPKCRDAPGRASVAGGRTPGAADAQERARAAGRPG
jgi:uncharacterized membrane protein